MQSVDKDRKARGFDKDAALAAALREFWRHGFEGVSMDDLTSAMGISRPTLYTVYGGKEALFLRALEYYSREEATFYRQAAGAATASGVADAMLRGALELFLRGANPPGCMYVTHLVARGPEADGVRAEIIARTRSAESALCERFERAVREGDLPSGVDVVGLAHFLMGLVQGLAVQSSSGASREAMERMVEIALKAWSVVEQSSDTRQGKSTPSRNRPKK